MPSAYRADIIRSLSLGQIRAWPRSAWSHNATTLAGRFLARLDPEFWYWVPGAAGVRVWQTTSGGQGPEIGQALPEGIVVASLEGETPV